MNLKYWFFSFCLSMLVLSTYSVKAQDREVIDAAAHDTVVPNGYNYFHYDNGAVSSEGPMKNRIPDGFWKNYYESGKLKSKGIRRGVKLDSTWQFFSEKGFIAMEFNYKDGLKEGPQKSFFDSTKLRSVENYVADKRQGMAKYFRPNGYILREIPFEEGVENGIAKEFDNDSTIILISYYKNGFLVKEQEINRKDARGFKEGPWKFFYENSQQVKWEGNFKNNLKNGTFREYDISGKVIKSEEYLNGQLVDLTSIDPKGRTVKMEVRREYYPNAQDRIVGTYKNGVKDGIFREYSMEGDVIASTVYKDGKTISEGIMDDSGLEQGHWKYFFSKNKVKSEGDYKDGKRTGLWKFYHDNGNLMEQGSYVDGKPEGIWVWFYENGKTLRQETYKNGQEIGEAKEFTDSTAKVITQGSYEDGKKEGLWVYEIGQMKVSGKYVGGLEEGTWKEFYKNGKLSFEGSYRRGEEQGTHKFYYDNGRIQEERNYKLGQKDGVWRYYNREGETILTVNYKEDTEVKVEGIRLEAEKQKRKRAMKR